MAKYCESVQNTPNCGTKSEIEKSPTIFTCKYALKPYFLPLQEKDKSLNSFKIQGLALFCLFLKWYHQESNRGHKDFQSFALPTELWHHPDIVVRNTPFRIIVVQR